MNNGHDGCGDHPVELVEQLQIGPLTIENKTLSRKVTFSEKMVLVMVVLDICCCFSRYFWIHYDPIRVEDKDGAEEEYKEGGRSVDQSNLCSCLQFGVVSGTPFHLVG